tara:strand:- start:5541 stop:6599 length:1059 start_codon:yes stop_codon:yes gene_type:complete
MVPLFKVNMSPDAGPAVQKVLESGMIGEGPAVKKFTGQLRTLWDNQNVICTNSCTSALVMALRLAGVGPGDNVITSPFTFPATNCAVKQVGADIVWGSIDNTFCLSLRGLPRAKAIIITLVAGNIPEGLEEFLEQAAAAHCAVIFDAAHAFLTEYKGKHISHWADYTCFSFQSIKHLTTGDGGALACRNEWDHARARKMKWFGMSRDVPEGWSRTRHQMEYSIREWGYKAHMNDISATIGLANINLAIDAVNKSRENTHALAAFYHLPTVPDGCIPSWWVLPVRNLFFPKKIFENAGIQVSKLWKLNDDHDAFPNRKLDRGSWTPYIIPNGSWVTSDDIETMLKAGEEADGV